MGQPEGGGQTRNQGSAEEQDDGFPEGLHPEDHHPEGGPQAGHQQVTRRSSPRRSEEAPGLLPPPDPRAPLDPGSTPSCCSWVSPPTPSETSR